LGENLKYAYSHLSDSRIKKKGGSFKKIKDHLKIVALRILCMNS
jgi:hypothetical protein